MIQEGLRPAGHWGPIPSLELARSFASTAPLRLMLVTLAGLPAWPMDAIGAAAALADRLDRLQVHQFGQVTPGRGTAHLGEADGLAQGHAAREPLWFSIQ